MRVEITLDEQTPVITVRMPARILAAGEVEIASGRDEYGGSFGEFRYHAPGTPRYDEIVGANKAEKERAAAIYARVDAGEITLEEAENIFRGVLA